MTEAAPRVELVAIGNELLLGETVDTNSAWLGRRLAAAGLRVTRVTKVGDVEQDIQEAVGQALERAGTVICTGGLGPTSDDRTKPAIAALLGRELVLHEPWLEHMEQRFRERGIRMAALNRNQAEIPSGSHVFHNARGTAPGVGLIDDAGRIIVLLPGVPREMHGLIEEHVLAFLLQHRQDIANPILHHVVRTAGIAESTLAERVEDVVSSIAPLTVAYLPSWTGVDLRITSWGVLTVEASSRAFLEAEGKFRERVGTHIYATGEQDLVDSISAELTDRRLTLSLAESCTGGLLAKRLTDKGGASTFLQAGIVSYSNEAKEQFLGVRKATLAQHGAVSEQTAREMADGVRRAVKTDLAISITGVAGPGGGSEEKPVGLVWIAVALPQRTVARMFRFGGDRQEIRERSAQAALLMLWNELRNIPS